MRTHIERRSPSEIKMMTNIVTKLLRRNRMNADKAHSDLILISKASGFQMPYYVKSIQDFYHIKKKIVSKEG